jgi:2-isopropylmalate synthase
MRHKRSVTPAQVEKETLDALDHARTVGFTDISLAFEDATRGDMAFMTRLIEQGLERGITAIAIPDTVGCCLPEQFRDLIAQLRAVVGDGIRISIHLHDDLGLAVANAVAGIQGGADEVQTTLCGIGERAGNTAIEELVAILNSKQAELHCVHDVVTHRLVDACSTLAGMIGLEVPRHKAILGTNAFSTEAGMHQQGVLRHRFTYEWLRAEDYGATPRVAMGRHSGRTIVRHRLVSSGIAELDERAVDAVYEAISHADSPEQYESTDVLVAAYRQAIEDLVAP